VDTQGGSVMQLQLDFNQKTARSDDGEIVKGLKRKAYYSLEEASQFLGQSLRAIKRRKDLWINHGEKGVIGYCDMFQANLHDVKMGCGKRHPELEHIYSLTN
jgi:hypothetical protein